MSGVLDFLRQHDQQQAVGAPVGAKLFAAAPDGADTDPANLVVWETRAKEVGATQLSPARGRRLLQALWAKDKQMRRLESDAVERMEPFLAFATVLANLDLIRQGERGDYMLVLLSGSMAVDRLQPWGERLHLTEIVPGEMLGEMSLFDGGVRFSTCTTLSECEVAVLSADAMDDMLRAEPLLTASLVTMLARKLSLRLRAVSARLSEMK